MSKSLSGSAEEYRELTLRGMILGALITIIFTASNVYLGLKVGLTFASSIPAAVIWNCFTKPTALPVQCRAKAWMRRRLWQHLKRL